MRPEFNESVSDVQRKLQSVSSLVLDFLLPQTEVLRICEELEFGFRDRVYNPMVVVWMFISQVLSADHSCQQAVSRFNAWRVARGLMRVSSETTSYCKARCRLPEELFERLLSWTALRCEQATNDAWLFRGRIVEMVDGWTVTMADTNANQQAYPQMKSQRPGCGFPIARMVGVFSLATGAIGFVALGPFRGKQTGETSLLRSILDRVLPGRILLADRYYASFWLLAQSEMRGIDLVARVHQLRLVDFRRGLKQGCLDQLVAYPKPGRPNWMNRDEYRLYPDFIFVRHLTYRVEQLGFRTRAITLATTLLDAEVYPAEELARLYSRRWQVELHIRSLKSQMQMDHLRCKSPQMVRKEIHCHMIGFNLVRAAMLASALKFKQCPTRLSFAGAMQAIDEFASSLRLRSGRREEQWGNLLETISELTVGHRPGRQEKRELKRRQKNYKLMTTPRNPNRNRFATAA
ncbi:IS4 family transposase [Rubripirellula reticaptiva]|uniref:Transposase DDE domain protein n=1 Tax=Rubripirellula reticaptiva TaxID=2528013 RepID=A0A5C6EE04_9BACT|nr:IS4 family transposase [Rubripirellula reticaptiva]TWU47973.1 Transposase DDE domain protein [Rubripirellula reticaptiva]